MVNRNLLAKNRPRIGSWSRALLPGLHIKRWLLLLSVGVTIAGLGLALLIDTWIDSAGLPRPIAWLTLRFLPEWLRGLFFLAVGVAISMAAVWYLNRSIIAALLPGQSQPGNLEMVHVLLQRQRRRQGPRVVAIGGGTGMPQLLRGLREYTDNITAIVTVADDGGSSGRLRRQMRMLPPGDFRNNIAALSESEDLMARLFQYRFPQMDSSDSYNGAHNGEQHGEQHGEQEPDGATVSPGAPANGAQHRHDAHAGADEINGLAGHSFGNLFITTMAAVTGSFESGIAESSRVLAVRGRVLPSTLEQLTLCAEIQRTAEDGSTEWLVVEGESKIPAAGGHIERVFLQPENPRAYPLTLQAILQADLIVAGPGSFFTSVMPNLLVPDIRAAICAGAAPRIYICNVATQPGETDGYSVSDHMLQLRRHVGDAFTTVLANDNFAHKLETTSPFVGDWVRLPQLNETLDYQLFTGDLTDQQRPWRHDAKKLAARLMAVYEELQHAKKRQPV